MVKSILDTDLYKFSTSYAYMKLYPHAEGTFEFVDRNKTEISNEVFNEIKQQIRKLSDLSLNTNEKEWCIKNIPYIPQHYWEWLSSFRFNFNKINLSLDENNHLHISVTDKLYKVSLYEVPILAIVSQVFSSLSEIQFDQFDVVNTTLDKIIVAKSNDFKFSEFGTRRRFSNAVQNSVIETLKNHGSTVCTGTSNVYFAYKYNMKPMGTHPHEWFMFHGAQFGYKHANYLGMTAWSDVYDGNLGIALTDTYTSNNFFKNFSMKLAKLFDGIRQDSGDEYEFAQKAINRYNELGIDPKTKTIIFSNALTFHKAAEIAKWCRNKIKCSFGIGTNLTNDWIEKRPNIVMKLVKCRMNSNQNWQECIKISDDLGKHLGSSKEIEHAFYELDINQD